ncbi:hypothetical protein RI103_14050 [Paraburkholderia sp. FT54]|uniref:hypothetical protein n=1 Tax=Paraburkholderia sp. FT54 TaxID=3074437 RepID=UPI002877EA02|nr:hypothetical protein [Paraburkholderia sp. FT54]WNC88821.1 hypothetical protein RI103_14050 [Paraburkholderia sp. FT54]
MSKPVNLASLPKDEALVLSRVDGRAIFGDVDAVTHVYSELMSHWLSKRMPRAVGQSDEEFGDLVEEVEKEFNAGVDEAVSAVREDGKSREVIKRIDDLVTARSMFAFRIQAVVAFMVEALPDDAADQLPVKFTLTGLRDDLHQLGENLLDLVHEAEHG